MEYHGDSIQKFQKLLNSYSGNLTELRTDYCHDYPHFDYRQYKIECHIQFHDDKLFAKFVSDLAELSDRLNTEQQLQEEYPKLKEAYEHYLTLVKLYGG